MATLNKSDVIGALTWLGQIAQVAGKNVELSLVGGGLIVLVDIADARRLLAETRGSYDVVWQSVAPFLQPGHELTAK